MNLWLRLLITWLRAFRREPVSVLDEFRSTHIVWPGDIDLFGHVNNGRYFTITDLDRMEILFRAGTWREMRKRGLYPVMAGETMQFRRPLKLFQRYEILSRPIGWDERHLYMEHRFHRDGLDLALAIVKIRTVGASRPSPAEVFRLTGETVPDVHMSEVLERWDLSTKEQWESRRPLAGDEIAEPVGAPCK